MSLPRHLLRALVETLVNPAGAIGHLVDAFFASRDRAADIARPLDVADGWTPDRSPAALLDGDRGVVPFHAGREPELAHLEAWLDDPSGLPLMLRLYTAPGGYGKTRLLRELVRRRNAEEYTRPHRHGDLWDAGFLREAAGEAELPPLFAGRRPLLLVLDYAESRGRQIAALITAARPSKRRRVRLVFLARSDKGWWSDLRTAGDGVGDFFLGPAVRGPLVLGPVADTPELRRTAFLTAASAFAEALGCNPPAAAPPLDDGAFECILLVHALALAAVEGEPDVAPAALLDWLVARERRGLDRAAVPVGLPLSARPTAHRAAVLVTLAGGADSLPEAEEIVARTPGLSADTIVVSAELLHRLYGGRRWCEGVQPDLVGEHLVDEELRTSNRNGDPRLLEAAFGEGVPARRLEMGLTILSRLAKRSPVAAQHLDAVFRLRPLAPLAEAAIAVAQIERDPLGRHLADALRMADDVDTARRLLSCLPETTTALREVALVVTTQVHRHVLEALPEHPSDEHLWELASLKNNLSIRLAALGHREEGLEEIKEAVAILRRFPSSETALAGSLTNLAIRLRALGHRDEGLAAIEEAVEIRQRLVADCREEFEPDLARSLTTLSSHLAAMGRREESLAAVEKAVEIRSRLAELQPKIFAPVLANSFNNLANRLAGLGHREKGLAAIEDAVEIRHHLAAERPEAFEPELARTLTSLSNHLAGLGHYEEGLTAIEEAVAIRRRLAAARPEAFEPGLATSLNDLSSRLAEVGRREEGLAAITEATAIRRRLATWYPAAFELDLAVSLNNLSSDLAAFGRLDDGLAAIEESVEIRRRLAQSRPEAFEAGLADSLNNLSVRLADVARCEEGLVAIEEAVEIYRRLAALRPEAFEHDLAMSLNNLSIRLKEVERIEESLTAIEQAVEIYRRLARAHPEVFGLDLATSLGNLVRRLLQSGRVDRAAVTAEECLRRLVPLLEKNSRRTIGLVPARLSLYRRAKTAAGRAIDEALVDRVEILLSAAASGR